MNVTSLVLHKKKKVLPVSKVLLLLFVGYALSFFHVLDLRFSLEQHFPILTQDQQVDMPTMELEEYLSTLKYYGGGLTGKLSAQLVNAIETFKKDINSGAPYGELSDDDRKKLQRRYWVSTGGWASSPPFYFYADDKRILAYGGAYLLGKGPFKYTTVKIACYLEEKVCFEVDMIARQSLASGAESIDLQPDSDVWHIYPAGFGSDFHRYTISEIHDGVIIAKAANDDQYIKRPIPNMYEIFELNKGKRQLVIDVAQRSVKRVGIDGPSEDIQVVDFGDILIHERYSDMRKRSYINSQEKQKFDTLVTWLEQRDVSKISNHLLHFDEVFTWKGVETNSGMSKLPLYNEMENKNDKRN